MIKCKVIGCNNSEFFMRESGKHKTMKGCYGYCQIHFLEGLVEEISQSNEEKKA